MLTTRYKPFFERVLRPLAARLARSGVDPSAITVGGAVLATMACAGLVWARAIPLFCLVMGVIGCLDGLDGAVARAGGRVTGIGAYLDAMADRYVETIVTISVAAVTEYWLLSMLVLSGSLLVSYAKARAAMEVQVSNQEWPDVMERAERGIIFLVGLAAGALLPWRPLGRDLFWWTLCLLATLTYLTVVQRIRRACRLIELRSPRRAS
jgi:phosphatidylglycerophosphate synthase